ncbi:MAG TPA: FAD-dependent monooxygenase [Methylibium sp.]|uniref:NAD(P)/FAD-dependent oxidoreductase n=1 Tax=Methylibium sp. TaxID=2067992 RepID=UPI002DB6435F|nr:FAD-dependent monooxygenase [Methylibium sp.]HEU4458198.1 FAD-dependent monooxygenase [Methylibium sp.]
MTLSSSHAARADVLILGGGLAGLTLALQLRQSMPDLDVRIVERREHPVPVAAHKIGESSVEIGAHYFAETLGLKAHLDSAHLRKFGFRFFFSEGHEHLGGATELGASRFLTTPSWQIDRGLFENFLAEEAQRRGVGFEDGATVKTIDLDAEGDHQVTVASKSGDERTLHARWLVDAAGRAGLLKKKLGLAEANGHDANAVWFRIDARLDVDNWVEDPAWRARCSPAARWLSTNHLCGPGYWLWLIPLGSGAHSVGIVCDAKMHPLETMNTYDRAMQWIAQYQPCVHEVLEAHRDKLMDFAFFKNYSYGCKQLLSSERWALTGDAGRFLDPFYSPGSDFIAIANTYITELVAQDRAGKPTRTNARFYDEMLRSLYDSSLALYRDQYPLFGNPRVMPVKVLWDYTYYWGVMCPLFFQQRLTDRAALADLREPLMRARRVNDAMQGFLRAWGEQTMPPATAPAREPRPTAPMLDQASLPWFAELNRGLRDALDDQAFRARIRANVELLEKLAAEIAWRGVQDDARLAAQRSDALPDGRPGDLLFTLAEPALA